MAKTTNDFNEFSDEELSPSRNLKNFGKNGMTDREIRGLTLAANNFLQLIQMEQYRRQLLKRADSSQALDENTIHELTSATEDMSQLVSDLQRITPALATTTRRVIPEIQTNLKDWQRQGKVMSASSNSIPIILSAEGDGWWNTFGGTSSSVNGSKVIVTGGGTSSPPPPDQGITETAVSEAVDQMITSLGPQLQTAADQLQQQMIEITSGQFQPARVPNLVTSLAGAVVGSGFGGGDFSYATVGLLFGTLAGVPAIGTLIGLVVDAIHRLLSAEEEPHLPEEPIQ
jgi:hypothetical protein